jgi:PAS domain S-box-containing protein
MRAADRFWGVLPRNFNPLSILVSNPLKSGCDAAGHKRPNRNRTFRFLRYQGAASSTSFPDMRPFQDPMENPGQSRSPGLAASLAVFVAGLVVGLGLAADLGGQFIAGLIILAGLSFILSLLQRIAENTRKRVTAGEASYRAFFDHAIEGIFRTTPGGHYLAVNQALAEIYGYPSPEALIVGLTDISAQLYADPRRRDEFRDQMQAHDVVMHFVSEIYHRSGKRIWISENARAVRDWSGELFRNHSRRGAGAGWT